MHRDKDLIEGKLYQIIDEFNLKKLQTFKPKVKLRNFIQYFKTKYIYFTMEMEEYIKDIVC